ncbi:MAG: NAD(P)/FAD-dependent oxidoreductase [Saprospiraceae bacterium]|nr:NAD(P)/FAD-dependent oxidoreductase [Candidatus Brachybacter algidus]MBL0118402.1 NAD(P)/FAD-dependent oxidoreductase [Candidatus Brachybacter algidus]
MIANIPETDLKRIVIIGAGFAGLKLAQKLLKSKYQVVLIDKENYHSFQPLMYQVATAGLEPSSIAFPLRKLFQHEKNFHIRNDEVISIDTENKNIRLKNIGKVNFDKLVISFGADTNYFGNARMQEFAMPMKSISEALALRNRILEDYEKAISITDYDARQELLDIVIVGGGATGVEIAGALADMKQYILPKDYNEIDRDEVDIYLVDAGDKLLSTLSEKSSMTAEKSLLEMGVKVIKNTVVKDYDGNVATFSDGTTIRTKMVIWAAGIIARALEGMPADAYGRGRRLLVNEFNQLTNFPDIYAIGDCALMITEAKPNGDPQVAQVAIQQAVNLAKNLKNIQENKPLKPFKYKDLGNMATIGRKKAVAELPGFKFSGFFAWLTWLFVHLMAILGTKNKIFIFINWAWSYITRDQSLRLILRTKDKG